MLLEQRPTSAEPVLVRLLDRDPTLADAAPSGEATEAARWTAGVLVDVPKGSCDLVQLADGLPGAFAALVLDGFLLRRCDLDRHPAAQVAGPGDLLPVDAGSRTTARALMDTAIVLLDRRFLAAARRWPWLFTAITVRLGRTADEALSLRAISHQPRAERRVQQLLEHLAGRWGRQVPEGTLVPLSLTHTELGILAGARRPTITLAVGELEQAGLLARHIDGWLLPRAAGPQPASGRFVRAGGATSTPSSSARPYIR